MDTRIWDEFEQRDDDIVIATYPKSGTTWVQQIVGQLVFSGSDDVPISSLSPWLELRVQPKVEKLDALAAQTHRRFVKSHSPATALPMSDRLRYIFCGRDGRDAVWSMYAFHASFVPFFYELLNAPPGPYGPPLQPPNCAVEEYFRHWLAHDGAPFWSLWETMRSWWALREAPNILLVHYADLKRDLRGEILRIAQFLGYDPASLDLPSIVEHAGFEYMKRHAALVAPLAGAMFEGGAESFINKGVNGRWQQVLTADDCARYEARARAELGEECAAWLAMGRAGI